MKHHLTAAAFAATAMLSASAMPAVANVEVGVLSCHVAPSVGYVIASQREMRCHFRPSAGGSTHHYRGSAGRIGIDLGVTREGWLTWGVWAPTNRIYRKDLVGTYAGASVGAAVGVGVGANALVGGSNNTIALQPLSGESSVGLSVALGITALSLQ
jgi:opacity protein-like surface antigen